MSEVGARAVTRAISGSTGPAICAYLTAGYPSRSAFPDIVSAVAAAADVVEIGVPFTDPMADGLTIQRASRVALDGGVTLDWILESVGSAELAAEVPLLLMGYYNPFLAHGLDRLGESLVGAGVSGLIVPDVPLEEADPLLGVLGPRGLGLVQLITPTTPADRRARLARASGGFVYAVTMTGVTGGRVAITPGDIAYLEGIRSLSPLPVMAGFGIRGSADVATLAPHVDGVIVGSALIEAIDRGEDPGEFLRSLRLTGVRA
jgi:tryptophan synthase alpha chain